MNLRSIANRATRGVNPNITATVRVSTGYAKDASFRQVPSYVAPTPVTIQAQALTKKDIDHLASMNISDNVRAVYANMQLTGVDRTTKSGGDLLTFEGADWLVVAVLEQWPTSGGWCKVALVKQMPNAG